MLTQIPHLSQHLDHNLSASCLPPQARTLCTALPFPESAAWAMGGNVSLSGMDAPFVPVFWLHQGVWGHQTRVMTRTVLRPSLAIRWFAKSDVPSNIQAMEPSRTIGGWRSTVQTLTPPPRRPPQHAAQGKNGLPTGRSCQVSVPTLALCTVWLHFPRPGVSWTFLLLLAAEMRIACLLLLAASQMSYPQAQCAKGGFQLAATQRLLFFLGCHKCTIHLPVSHLLLCPHAGVSSLIYKLLSLTFHLPPHPGSVIHMLFNALKLSYHLEGTELPFPCAELRHSAQLGLTCAFSSLLTGCNCDGKFWARMALLFSPLREDFSMLQKGQALYLQQDPSLPQ